MKTWLSGWTVVASILIILTFLVGGWLDWLGDPLWVTGIATLGTGVILGVTALVALDGLKDARKTRHGELVTALSRRWDESFIVKSQTLYSEIGPTGIIELADRVNTPSAKKNAFTDEEGRQYAAAVEEFNNLLAFPSLVDTIGVLVDEGVIDPKVVYKLWGPVIALAWRTWREPVVRLRDQWGRPSTYRYFQMLGEQMAELEANDLAAAQAEFASPAESGEAGANGGA